MAQPKTKTIVVRPLLIEAREKKHLTSQALAKLIGVDNSYIFFLEHNKRSGNISVWRKIQEALALKDKDMWLIINTTKRINRKGF